MQTLKPIDPETASPKAKQPLDVFEQLRGRSFNMQRGNVLTRRACHNARVRFVLLRLPHQCKKLIGNAGEL